MKTTTKDFEFYKKEVQSWVDTFGLKGFELHFNHEAEDDARATVQADTENGMAIFNLSSEWQSHPVTQQELTKTAYHEVVELLLWDVRQLLSAFFSDEVVNRKIHAVIRRMENHQFG